MRLKLLFIPLLVLLFGCGGAKALYELPKTPPQYGKAVLIHFNAVGEQIADLRDDPTISPRSKGHLLAVYRRGVCSQDELNSNTSTPTCAKGPAQRTEAASKAYQSFASAKTEAELQAAVDDLTALLIELVNAVKGAN